MQTNGKPTTTERVQDFQFPPFPEPPKPQPLTKTQQIADQVATKLALVKQKQDLELERMLGKIAAVNAAKPIIETIVGDPNHNLQQLTKVILERGCDCAEHCVEMIIDDD